MFSTAQKIKMIKTQDISPNPYQARRNFDKDALLNLSLSIKENGMLSPLIVRGFFGGYELICGQRRLRAAIMAGFKEVPAIIIKAKDAQCASLTLIENLQRENLSLSEEADGYYNLMAYHRIKKDRLLKNLSLDSIKVNEKVRLLSLSEKVRYKIEEKGFPEKFAKELLKLHDEEKQLEIIEKAEKEDLSFTDFSKIIKEELRSMSEKKKEKQKPFKHQNIEEKMPVYINTVKKTVELLRKSGAKVELLQNESEEISEFIVKIRKK